MIKIKKMDEVSLIEKFRELDIISKDIVLLIMDEELRRANSIMGEFLKFVSKIVETDPLHFELYYSKTLDWVCHIYKKGCGKNGRDLQIFYAQGPELERVITKANVELRVWLIDNKGGY